MKLQVRDPVDLGDGWKLEPVSQHGKPDTIGYMITGPAAEACPLPGDGLCGGLVRIADTGDGKPVWKVEQDDPLTLSPSIVCSCKGQHGFVRDGKYVPA